MSEMRNDERNDDSKREGSVPLREYQLFQLPILAEFVRICEKYDLTYWAAYGTLLGAVRHQGFIPWDDDVDLWMPPVDYLKFRKVCPKALKKEFYFQVHCDNPQNYIEWQRIGVKNSTSLEKSQADIHGEWGICIDIFPLASCSEFPPSESFMKDYRKRVKRFLRLSQKYLYLHDARSLKGIWRLYHLYRGRDSDRANIRKWKKAERAVLGNEKDYQNARCLLNISGDAFDKGWFARSIDMPFETMTLKVPVGYREVLSCYYGDDWEEIPAPENRICHSGGGSDSVLVSLTEPYTKYLV